MRHAADRPLTAARALGALPAPARTAAAGLRLALARPAVAALLAEAGLPTPEHVEYDLRSISTAVAFLDRVGTCVIKPARDTDGGSGATTDVSSRGELARASIRAARL